MGWVNDVHMSDVEGKLGYRVLEADLEYQDRLGNIWVTPEGRESDLSSFPYLVRALVKTTILVKSPFLHDYLYEEQPINPLTGNPVTRQKADEMYRDGAVDEGLGKWVAYPFYWGLRMGGWVVFRNYSRILKAQREADDNA